jgi:hypothetical protein
MSLEAEAKTTDEVFEGIQNAGGSEMIENLGASDATQSDYSGEESVYDNVEAGEVENEISDIDWKGEAKKFQSMYDKTQYEKQRMEDALLRIAEQRVSQPNNGAGVGNQESTSISLSEEEFNPWDAYYKPDSPSYKFRSQKEYESVNSAVSAQMSALNERVVLNNTVSELRNVHKMNDSEVNEFMNFATKPVDDLDLGTLVNVWRSSNSKGRLKSDSSLDAVRNAKGVPRTAGVLQGQSPQKKSVKDEMWDRIVSAGDRNVF